HHFENARPFVHRHALVTGVIEQQLIKLATPDLPGLRRRVRLVIDKVKRLRQLAVLVDELDAVLFDKMAAAHLAEHVEPLQDPIGLRNERLADVEAREALALEKLDAIAALREQRGGRRAGRAAADNEDVGTRAGVGHADSLKVSRGIFFTGTGPVEHVRDFNNSYFNNSCPDNIPGTANSRRTLARNLTNKPQHNRTGA